MSNPQREVVVARWNEDVSWCADLPATIYNKGDHLEDSRLRQRHLPNVGRESHTYLWHIVSQYDNLADFTVFCQGNSSDHLAAGLPPGLTVAGLLGMPAGLSFGMLLSGMREVIPATGKLFHREPWRTWLAEGYMRPAKLTLADWFKKRLDLDLLAMDGLTYSPGAVFGASRDVLRSRPRAFYQKLLAELCDHANPEEAYYVERAWFHMLAAPGVELSVVRTGRPGQGGMIDLSDDAPALALQRGGSAGLAGLEACRKEVSLPAETAVFLGVPSYDALVPQALEGLMHATFKAPRWTVQVSTGSLLCLVFNRLWAIALNSRREQKWTHFAMHHADVQAPEGWLDTLIAEQQRAGADILSVVLPIKDNRRLTSTGLYERKEGVRRLTMKEIARLPVTFDAKDAGAGPDESLAVNTGLWVCDFTKPWVEEHCFHILDGIKKGGDGIYRAQAFPEDWNFSWWAHQRGLKVMATRLIPAVHHGKCAYDNQDASSGCETDPGDG